MARVFDDGTPDYLLVESPAVTTYPLAMAGWFNTDDDNLAQCMMWVGDKDVENHHSEVFARSDAGNVVQAFSHNYGQSTAHGVPTSTTFTANTWHHGAGVFLNVSERHVYLDGGGKGSDTGTVGVMDDHDRTAIGMTRDSSAIRPFSGHLAELAFWDLTDWGANDAARELAFEKALLSLAKGYSPAFFPLGLVAYWPLVRGLNDKSGGLVMTPTGTVVSAHPRIIYPSPIHFNYGVAAAPPVGMAGAMTTNTGYWGW